MNPTEAGAKLKVPMSDDAMLLYGTSEPAAAQTALRAGALTAVFSGGGLRNIRIGGVEIIRGIHFLIRDRNWSTVVPDLSDLSLIEDEEGFRISFGARGKTASDGQTISWRASIKGSPLGIRFGVETVPMREEFVTCRTGFVVLHPLDKVAGCLLTVEHSDGAQETTVFPQTIAPQQCLFDVVALSHSPLAGLTATCRMQGGAWETEDHRNWMDASFKTYFRALALPWPYKLAAGETVCQSVDLSIQGKAPADEEPTDIFVVFGDPTGRIAPAIGLFCDSRSMDATLAAARSITSLGVRILTLRVSTDSADLPEEIARGAALQDKTGCDIALEIVVAERGDPPDQELALVAEAAAKAGLKSKTVAVSSAHDLVSYPPSVTRPVGHTLEGLYKAAHSAFPGLPIGGGSFAFFTELNRRPPPTDGLDFVQWGTASINHAADDLSVMETLQTVPHQIRSAAALAGDLPLRITPVTIAMPLNPYGESLTPNPELGRVTMARRDPRHAAQFGAAFLAGYVARAAAGGVASLAIGAPTGDFGVLAGDTEIPAAAIVRGFASMSGGALLQAACSAPQQVLACAIEKEGVRRAIVANLTGETVNAKLAGWPISSISLLAAGNPKFVAVPIVNSAIKLPPYGVAIVEG